MVSHLSVTDSEDIGFQRKEWLFQRFGWTMIILFLGAAALGLFGHGLLSGVTAGDDESVEVSYDRFDRHLGLNSFSLTLGGTTVEDGIATVFVDADLLRPLQIESIYPQPDTTTTTREGTIFEFSAKSDSPPVVTVHYRPEEIGPRSGEIRGGGEVVTISQFTYP